MRNTHKDFQTPEELCVEQADKSMNVSRGNEERSYTFDVNADDGDVDQTCFKRMCLTGKCDFCEYKHPVTYRDHDHYLDCQDYPSRGIKLYEHMKTFHMDMVEQLDKF